MNTIRVSLLLSALASAALVLGTGHAAEADGPRMSLKDTQQWAENAKLVADKARVASEQCGTTITATIDIPSYKGWAPERLAPTEQCRDALVSIGAICRTPAGKSAVQQSVSTVTCRRSGDSNTGTKLTRQGKGVVVAIEPTKAYVVDKKGSTTSWEYALKEVL